MQFRKRRKSTYFYVELEVNKVRFSLRLLDVSTTGVKLCGDHEVVDGTAGVVTVRGQTLPGMLRWVDGRNIGFEFDTPLPARIYAMLARQKPSGAKKRFLVH